MVHRIIRVKRKNVT